jgi:hypothetical protein
VYKRPESRSLTVSSGGTTSAAFGVGDYTIAGVITPSALTSTAITFTASDTFGGTYAPVYDSDGNQVSLSAAASRAIGLSGAEADALAPFKWLKLVCGSAEAADRAITVVLK